MPPSGPEMKAAGDAFGAFMDQLASAGRRFSVGLVFSQIVNGQQDKAKENYDRLDDKQKEMFADAALAGLTFVDGVEVEHIKESAGPAKEKLLAAPGFEACKRCGAEDNVVCKRREDDAEYIDWAPDSKTHVGRYYNTDLFSRHIAQMDKQDG